MSASIFSVISKSAAALSLSSIFLSVSLAVSLVAASWPVSAAYQEKYVIRNSGKSLCINAVLGMIFMITHCLIT
jgi:hypothetical protein